MTLATIVTEIYGAKLDDSGNSVTGEDGHFVPDKLLAHAVMEKRQGWGDANSPGAAQRKLELRGVQG